MRADSSGEASQLLWWKGADREAVGGRVGQSVVCKAVGGSVGQGEAVGGRVGQREAG